MIRFLSLFLLFAQISLGQTLTSTLRGTVTDRDNGQRLAGASILLSGLPIQTVSNENGLFRFDDLPVGRYVLIVKYIGYETLTIPEILLVSGKEQVLNIQLSTNALQLPAATVAGSRTPAYNSVQEITTEQTLRYAATYLDPARVATSFAGVAAANDQANGLVVRGNSPNNMQWRLEGVEIVNPNHLSNAGTFSDRATTTGGGVNILSTQLLGTSYFLNGALPANYGNAQSAVMDMRLRNGNNEQTEFTGQAGLIGIDLAAEGPLSKQHKGSYLVNYRYSFTGLLGAMGVSFGGEDIRFQDLSFHLNFPTNKAGTFTVFGMGGISSNTFKADKDTSTWEFQKDGQNIKFKNKMGAIGVTHDWPINKQMALRTALVASGLTTTREASQVYALDFSIRPLDTDELAKGRVSINSALNIRPTDRLRLQAGGTITVQSDRLDYFSRVSTEAPVDFSLKGLIIQPFALASMQWSPKFSSEVGVHYLYYSKSSQGVLEPRAALRYQLKTGSQLSLSYGMQSQVPLPQVYLAGRLNGGKIGVSRSSQLVLGYKIQLPKNSSLNLEAYWQDLFDVPIRDGIPTAFSAINALESVPYHPLVNRGTGRNIGVEASWQKYLTDDLYFLISGSVYESTYKGSDGIQRSTRYDGRHTFSFTGGKEFGSTEERVWGVNAKILWIGGFRDTPIDIQASAASGSTVYQEDRAFSLKMKDYFRPDLRIYYKRNKSSHSSTFSLDLQNVTSSRNEAYSYFDQYQKGVVSQYQLGLIPVFSYRVQF
ncbi:TonB-dependent receptor [Dyadobacter tibetensis]|uniref:TonB-dependent receptor n=1 Tax=Dyadobacter tibetensis TaxID=1211851 RepID=UPI0004703F33|nr:TonB-dependent receptor [Dyadobacter tibetensis]